jgi:archaetidylinositol phosphate synthase
MTLQDQPILKDQRRLNEGLLQPLERPLLQWLATRLPTRMTSDDLTAIGLTGAAVAFAGYALSRWHPGFLWLATAGLIVNWFGDSLDGTVARLRKAERPRYGFFIDHTTDVFAQVLLALGLGLSSYVRFEIACLALIAYLVVAVYTFVRTNVFGVLQIAFNGIGPTEVRIGMIFLNLRFFMARPEPIVDWWAPLSAIDLLILASAAAVLVFVAVSIRRDGQRLAAEDPPRADARRTGR